MRYIKTKNLKIQEAFKSVIKNSDEWYTRDEFFKILKKERNRSDRTDSPISYILFDLSNCSKENVKISEDEYVFFLKKLIAFISESSRDYDIKFLINPFKIGILLLDTSMDGAKIFIEKTSENLYRLLKSLQKKEYISLIHSITISSYPLNQMSQYEKLEASPFITEDIKFEKNDKKENKNLMFRQGSSFGLNWRLQAMPNGTIALTKPILLDLFFDKYNNILYKTSKRLIDIIISLIVIVFYAPVALIIGMAIKTTSKGPIHFTQKRLGRFGKTFTFLKFRTMYSDSDENVHREYVNKLIKGKNREANLGSENKPFYKITHDKRITPVGNFLRKTSLDEIPQFFNVLMGDMSLVGPRPPIPYEIETYQNWHLRRVLEVKPGITGWWQVNGRSSTTFDEMVRMDLHYVENQSFLLDLKIILKTIAVMFNTDGA